MGGGRGHVHCALCTRDKGHLKKKEKKRRTYLPFLGVFIFSRYRPNARPFPTSPPHDSLRETRARHALAADAGRMRHRAAGVLPPRRERRPDVIPPVRGN
jgi:hypothetical protein